jgi:hypothetical protein
MRSQWLALVGSGVATLVIGCSNVLGYDELVFDAAWYPDGGVSEGGLAGHSGSGGSTAGGAGGWPTTDASAGQAGEGGTGGAGGYAGTGGSSGTGGSAGTGSGGASGQAGASGAGAAAGAGGGSVYPPELDLNNVVWLHTNVSSWPVTVNLASVTFQGGLICLNHDIASKNWPIGSTGSTEVVANPWVFIYHNDQWYGATWEWLRPPGQTCKNQSSVAGDHIKQSPFDAASGWLPESGETLYFMVSGIARYGTPNVQERSEPIRVVWP